MVVLYDLLVGTSSTHDHIFDVFISFRGTDTRNGFTDHLHKALIDANLKTFLDEEEIETGEELKPELERAIKSSRASIIVLSKNYATSRWCLDELVLILEQRLISDHIVIPIFYHVEPTDVRKQRSTFGDAMAYHKQKMEAETDVVKRTRWARKLDRWNKALTQVADLKGKDVNNRRETELIDEIVTNIYHSLGVTLKKNLPLLFGMEDSIEFITSWLKDKSSHTMDILTILGMGGIGKTSLAKYVHGSHRHLFKRSSFIESISEKCGAQVNGLLDLQKQLCNDISKTSQIQVHDILAYTCMIENALTRNKVFIVLDDIDSVDQLHALLGKKGFHPGSKILITTKDASLTGRYAPTSLIAEPKHTKHSLEGLHKKASLQLLSHHAFMSNGPNEGYEEVSKNLMAYCEGHPLALKVLGESLFNKTVAEWEDCIIGLKEEPDLRIKKALQMSFYSMPSNNDKELFKHIACFFVQKDRVFVETILNSCHIRTLQGIRNLIDRCLLTIGPGNSLMMHQLVQEMGRDVVRQESPNKPEKRSLIWCHDESFSVLEENKGTRNIKGLILDMKMLKTEKFCGSVELETCALSKISNLMILHLNFVQLNGSYKDFPKKLIWLCMHGFPFKSIPSDLPTENLVALDMSYSNIKYFDMSYSNLKQAGKGQKVNGSCLKDRRLLGSLKFLTLSFCDQLVSLGGFQELPIVERLIVRQCISLIKVCESIELCVELVHIDLSYCNKLDKLPRTIGRLKKVKTLLLDACNLGELPIKMKDVDSSEMHKDINISKAIVMAVPNDLKSFEVSLPSSLVRLSLAHNNMFNESFPMDMSCLSMLMDLCLDGNPIVSLPNCVRTLPRLETLGMNNCLMLTSVEHPPRMLRQLNLYYNCWKPGYKSLLRKILFDPEMAPLKLIADRNLLAPSSFEVEGMIKIQPMAGVDKKLLHSLGWGNIRFYNKISCMMVTSYNYAGQEESQIQLYYEFGIFSTIYVTYSRLDLGSCEWIDIMDCTSRGRSISFTIPLSPKNFRGLNFGYSGNFSELPRIKVSNITKNRIWIYTHYIQSINHGGKQTSFLSHWMFGMNEMEVGDQITITLEKCYGSNIICGFTLMYDDGNMKEETEEMLGYYKSWNHIIGGDLSPFQLTTGEYFLSSTEFLRSLFSSSSNAHYKEKTISFRAFSPTKSDILRFRAFSPRKSDILGHAHEEMSAPVIDGNEVQAGRIISTTIGGKNGEPKQAKCIETGETVAIKYVLQDGRYKNRELQLMPMMDPLEDILELLEYTY